MFRIFTVAPDPGDLDNEIEIAEALVDPAAKRGGKNISRRWLFPRRPGSAGGVTDVEAPVRRVGAAGLGPSRIERLQKGLKFALSALPPSERLTMDIWERRELFEEVFEEADVDRTGTSYGSPLELFAAPSGTGRLLVLYAALWAAQTWFEFGPPADGGEGATAAGAREAALRAALTSPEGFLAFMQVVGYQTFAGKFAEPMRQLIEDGCLDDEMQVLALFPRGGGGRSRGFFGALGRNTAGGDAVRWGGPQKTQVASSLAGDGGRANLAPVSTFATVPAGGGEDRTASGAAGSSNGQGVDKRRLFAGFVDMLCMKDFNLKAAEDFNAYTAWPYDVGIGPHHVLLCGAIQGAFFYGAIFFIDEGVRNLSKRGAYTVTCAFLIMLFSLCFLWNRSCRRFYLNQVWALGGARRFRRATGMTLHVTMDIVFPVGITIAAGIFLRRWTSTYADVILNGLAAYFIVDLDAMLFAVLSKPERVKTCLAGMLLADLRYYARRPFEERLSLRRARRVEEVLGMAVAVLAWICFAWGMTLFWKGPEPASTK